MIWLATLFVLSRSARRASVDSLASTRSDTHDTVETVLARHEALGIGIVHETQEDLADDNLFFYI